MTSDLEFSRPMATAQRLGDDATDKHLFLNKKVLLTGEPEILLTENGKNCFFSSMLLLIRICKDISILLSPTFNDLSVECKLRLEELQHPTNVSFVNDKIEFKNYDAILNIGKTSRCDLPWTVINSNGWVARVSSGDSDISGTCDQANPIGALAAASLGSAEIFKRLVKLKETRGNFLNGINFSLYSYKEDTDNSGPILPDSVAIDLLITGAGAIGNGLIYLLNLLPLTGRILIVDRQKFQPENIGTCILIGKSAMNKEKAYFAADYLKRLKAIGYNEDINEFKKRLGSEIVYPKAVVNGLDNIEARHEIQDLWPDIIIDGAIGDFGCQVSRHPWVENIACLKCLFQKLSKSADEAASKATGLDINRVKHALDMVTEKDVESAPSDKKEWIRSQIGQQICSVIREGVVQKISDEEQQKDFEPSVPFVACFSASMVIAELVKFLLNLPSPIEPRFQFDILHGPIAGDLFPQERRQGCICIDRKSNIDTIRSMRSDYIKQTL
jgi:molybdopterin/thiamine biosynthesis adenylyltransferase